MELDTICLFAELGISECRYNYDLLKKAIHSGSSWIEFYNLARKS